MDKVGRQSSERAASWSDLQCRRVLITGAAGSVGRALCDHIAANGCAALGLLDHFDHGLLEAVESVERTNPGLEAAEILCDVRDRDRLVQKLKRFKPDVVIHCAALKHVHMGERHPGECVLTNLVGVRNVVDAAAVAGAAQFMLVSSDKAASPVCIMGATKRLAELYVAGYANEHGGAMRLKAVRFGNIHGSQGSVVPRFAAQIEAGGPLLVTDAKMQRFFMSGQEAVNLILSVIAHQDARDATYYMEMGEPISILKLGREMIAASGRNIKIEFTGLRQGEKLNEELFDEYETVEPCGLDGVYRITPLPGRATVTSADVADLESAARGMEDSMVRQRVFAKLDACLGRESHAVG